MYHYDMGATLKCKGAHSSALLDNAADVEQYNEHEDYGKTTWVAKDLDWEPESGSADRSLGPINESLCSTCRRLFYGSGDRETGILSHANLGTFFNHLDFSFLQESTRGNCGLCNLVWQSLRLKKLRIVGEQPPLLYDFGNVVGSADDYFSFPISPWNIFAIRFFSITVQVQRDNRVLVALRPVTTLTLSPHDLDGQPQSITSATEQPTDQGRKNTGASASIAQIKQWLDQCKCSDMTGDFLPERLLDVGINQSDKVKVVEKKDVPPGSQYIALSHCWGKTPSTCKLLSSNVEDFMLGLALEDLPKTFQQSCLVARALGIQYIWIDSVCIMQDSTEDWERNAALMWEVYAKAFCTLAATASESSHQGLFRDREPSTVSDLLVQVPKDHGQVDGGSYCCFNHDEWLQSVDEAPLNKRAWVFQERLLSPRIIHFSEFSIFFECLEFKASERFPAGIPPRYTTSSLRNLLPRQPEANAAGLLKLWESFVSTYTSLGITFESDKLAAISALARHTSENFPMAGQYLTGLWDYSLLGQLCWTASANPTRSDRYRAPSWSWASVNGHISPNCVDLSETDARPPGRPMSRIVEVAVNYDRGPWLSASGGYIRMHAPLLRAKIVKAGPREASVLSTTAAMEKIVLEDSGTEEDRKRAEEARRPLTERGILTKGVYHITTLAEWYPEETQGLRTFGFSADGLPTGRSGRQKLGFADDGLVMLKSDKIDSAQGRKEFENQEDRATLELYLGVEDELLHLPNGTDIFAGNHRGRVDLDEELTIEELEELQPLFMPVFCKFNAELESEVEAVRGLIIVPTGKNGEYRRIGSAATFNYAVAPLLCSLGNQDITNTCDESSVSPINSELPAPIDVRPQDRIALSEFIPPGWPLEELEFIPRDYALYDITIV